MSGAGIFAGLAKGMAKGALDWDERVKYEDMLRRRDEVIYQREKSLKKYGFDQEKEIAELRARLNRENIDYSQGLTDERGQSGYINPKTGMPLTKKEYSNLSDEDVGGLMSASDWAKGIAESEAARKAYEADEDLRRKKDLETHKSKLKDEPDERAVTPKLYKDAWIKLRTSEANALATDDQITEMTNKLFDVSGYDTSKLKKDTPTNPGPGKDGEKKNWWDFLVPKLNEIGGDGKDTPGKGKSKEEPQSQPQDVTSIGNIGALQVGRSPSSGYMVTDDGKTWRVPTSSEQQSIEVAARKGQFQSAEGFNFPQAPDQKPDLQGRDVSGRGGKPGLTGRYGGGYKGF